MAEHSSAKIGTILLLALLQLAPTIAIAALASYDLSGVTRESTVGALEVGEATAGIAAPTGLTITVIRN